MKNNFFLTPKSSEKRIEETLRYHRDTARGEFLQRAYEWNKTFLYLLGVRDVEQNPYLTSVRGLPSRTYFDKSQTKHIRVEKALHMHEVEKGRLLAVDLGPAVSGSASGMRLDAIRNNALAHTALNTHWHLSGGDNLQIDVASLLTAYGTCALLAHGDPEGVFGVGTGIVPPWELLPLPHNMVDPSQQAGLCWRRMLPYEQVKEAYKGILRFPKDQVDVDKLRLVKMAIGQTQQDTGLSTPMGLSPTGLITKTYERGADSERKSEREEHNVPHVEFQDYYLTDSSGYCRAHFVLLGDWLAYTRFYGPLEERCPLAIARSNPGNSFWGRGVLDRWIGINREIELVLGDAIQTAREADRLSFLAIPMTSGINKDNFALHLRNRVLPWLPDQTAPQIRPEFLQMKPNTELHGKMIGLLGALMQETSSQGEMFQGGVPGRVDAASSLQTIGSYMDVALRPTIASMRSAFKQHHGTVLNKLGDHFASGSRSYQLLRIDKYAVGVQLDPNTLEVTPTEGLPKPKDVRVSTRAELPSSPDAIERKLDKAFQMQMLSEVEYEIAASVYGLELPSINDSRVESYQQAWLENLLLFNDGKEPSKSPYLQMATWGDIHPIHDMVHRSMGAGLAIRVAAPPVQAALQQHISQHQEISMEYMPPPLVNADMMGHLGSLPQQMAGEALEGGVPLGGVNPASLQ